MRAFVLVAMLAATLGGCSDPTGGSADGATVYDSVCASCHGHAGRPSEQMTRQLNVRDLTAPDLRAKATPEFIEHQVRTGSANKLMPSFQGALTNEQIKAVSAYVASAEFLKRLGH